jgi:hypothetical protein
MDFSTYNGCGRHIDAGSPEAGDEDGYDICFGVVYCAARCNRAISSANAAYISSGPGSFGYDRCSTKESQIMDQSHAGFYHGIGT